MLSFLKKTTRRRQYHQSKLNLGYYPVAYVDYPVAYVEYPVAYVDYPVAYVDYPVAYVEYPVEKTYKFSKTHFYYQFDAKLGQIVPMLVIRFFNRTPGSEKRDFLYKTTDIPPPRPLCYIYIYIYIYRRLGGVQPGNRFVSCARARGSDA